MTNTILQQLNALAPFLNQLRSKPEADCFYDWLSGGLLWTDEVPDVSQIPPEALAALRCVVWYRTALILGESKKRDEALGPEMRKLFPNWSGEAAAKHNEELWSEAQKLFPHWPGFAPARRSVELREKCIELQSKAVEEMDKLFPDK